MKKKLLSILLAVLMLSSVLTLSVMPADTNADSVSEPLPFKDVVSGTWYYSYVEAVYRNGYMNGLEVDEFSPFGNMRRAEIVTLLRRLAGEENNELVYDGESYTDVPSGCWYEAAVMWATAKKLVQGDGDGTFRPLDNVSRGEMAVILTRFFAYMGVELPAAPKTEAFADAASIPSWAADSAEAMRVAGIFGGDDYGKFNAKNTANRAEVAAMVVRFAEYTDVAKSIPVSGTFPIYSFEDSLSRDDLSAAMKSQLDPDGAADTMTISDFDALAKKVNAISIGGTETHAVSVVFTKGEARFARSYSVAFTNATEITLAEDMANVDSIGLLYEDSKTGLRISKADKICDTDGNIIYGEQSWGTHGGHENKIVRTRYGVYAVYLTDCYDKPDGYTDASYIFNVVKLTSDGGKVLLTAEQPRAYGSCLPNILTDGKGHIYVSVLANLYEKAWIDMYKIDEATETVVSSDHHVIDFDYRGSTGYKTHGYGYSVPILDAAAGKIYGFYNAGDMPGYIAWFIYDMNTGKWDTTCHTVTVEFRLGYIMGYPDGNGGFSFFGQRDVYGAAKDGYDGLSEYLGVSDYVNERSGYVFDAIYYFHVADATKDEVTVQTLYEPDYKALYEEKGEKVNYAGASYYGQGGTTFCDSDGNVHIIYSTSTKNHAIFDKDGNKIYDETINIGGKRSSYTYAMGEGKSGSIYLVLMNTKGSVKYANIEVWCAADGREFKQVASNMELLLSNEDHTYYGKEPYNTKFITTSTRNGSLQDGTIDVLFATAAGVKSVNDANLVDYHHVVVELP